MWYNIRIVEKGKNPKIRPQNFSGSIKINRYVSKPDEVIVESLAADLTGPEDLIVIPGHQPANPELGTADGQPILADIELLGAYDSRGEVQRVIIGKIKDTDAGFLVNAKQREGGIDLHAKVGDYFIGIGAKDGGLDAIGIVPDSGDVIILGPHTNFPSERYGVVSSFHNPRIHLPLIGSSHELILAATEDGIAIKLYPKEGLLPIRVKTRAFPEHRVVIEENTVPKGGPKIGEALFRFLQDGE